MKEKIIKEISSIREKRLYQRGLKEMLDDIEKFIISKENIAINEIMDYIESKKSGKLDGTTGRNNASLQFLKQTIRSIVKLDLKK